MGSTIRRWHTFRSLRLRRRRSSAFLCASKERRVKIIREFIVSTVIGGALVVVPAYLAILLLVKAIQSAATLVQPVAMLLPDWLPAQRFFSLLLLIAVCFLV